MASEGAAGSGLAGRYASALFELADDQKALDEVAGELSALKGVIAESEDLRRFIRSPLYGREDQTRVMAAILDKASAGNLTRRFVMVVSHNRRLFALPRMIDAFLAELAHRRGEVTAQVMAAYDLSETQKDALLTALRQAIGSKVKMDLKIDKGLIGGLVIKVGSLSFDGSIRSQLKDIQSQLLEEVPFS